MMTKTFLPSIAAAVLLVACSGADTPPEPPCTPKVAPAGAPAVRLALTRVDFGDHETWRTTGFDLDSACTTKTSRPTCARHAGAPTANALDGDDGIDNSWGHNILDALRPIIGDPNAQWSGRSYLEVTAAGRGRLVLIAADNLYFEVPLIDVRLDWDGKTGTLGAIVPYEQASVNLRRDLEAYSAKDCGGTADVFVSILSDAADIPTNGVSDPGVACDGVSLGLSFDGDLAGDIPEVGPSLCEKAADGGP